MHNYAIKGVEQKMKISPPVYDAVFIDHLSPFWKSLLLHLHERIRRKQQATQNSREKLPINVASYTKGCNFHQKVCQSSNSTQQVVFIIINND